MIKRKYSLYTTEPSIILIDRFAGSQFHYQSDFGSNRFKEYLNLISFVIEDENFLQATYMGEPSIYYINESYAKVLNEKD